MTEKQLVLVVDDNPDNLKVLGSILTENGLKPAFAQNGRKALTAIQTRRPDLILLDIMMPELDGFEVCKQLQQNPETQDIPVIFLTAKTEKEDVLQGLELGAVDYVTKPFNNLELIKRVKTHLRLKATEQQLKQALAIKDQFFSIIAHDLGNIFHTSLGASRLLVNRKGALEEEDADEMLSMIQDSLNKGEQLLKNLLEWSRSQRGKISMAPAAFQLRAIIDYNLRALEAQANRKNIHLSSWVGDISVVADQNMFNTVIRNLLSNAIKFTPAGGSVTISAEEQDHRVEISISDTGVGIKPKDIDKLFQIDVRHTTLGTAQEQGSGLGLLLCQEFIDKNGGTLGVESEWGKGSRFYINLPSG
jgi:two-component system sensor histidine kinase/response regulator